MVLHSQAGWCPVMAIFNIHMKADLPILYPALTKKSSFSNGCNIATSYVDGSYYPFLQAAPGNSRRRIEASLSRSSSESAMI